MFNTVSLSEEVQKALKEEILAGPLLLGRRESGSGYYQESIR